MLFSFIYLFIHFNINEKNYLPYKTILNLKYYFKLFYFVKYYFKLNIVIISKEQGENNV